MMPGHSQRILLTAAFHLINIGLSFTRRQALKELLASSIIGQVEPFISPLASDVGVKSDNIGPRFHIVADLSFL